MTATQTVAYSPPGDHLGHFQALDNITNKDAVTFFVVVAIFIK